MSNPDWASESAPANTSTDASPNQFAPDHAVESAIDHAKEIANQFEHNADDATSRPQPDGPNPFELKPGDSNPASNENTHPFEKAANEVEQKVKDAKDQLKQAADAASQEIEAKAKETTNTLNQAAEEASNQAKSTLEKVEQKVESVVASVKESDIVKKIEQVGEEAANEVKEACTSVEQTLESAKSKIASTLGDEEPPKEIANPEAEPSQKNSNLVRNIGICAVGAVAVFLIARFISKRRK